MPKKTMRKYLRKPKSSTKKSFDWAGLYRRTLSKIEDLGLESDADPRVKLLLGGGDDPERTLRRLSIISDKDLDREFGD